MADTDPLYAVAFACSSRTERCLRSAFPGREARVQRASVPGAVRYLAASPAPRVVVLDLSSARDLEAAVRSLVSVCPFDTVSVGIGPVIDASSVRLLLRAGLSDYLSLPVAPAALRTACAGALADVPDRFYAGRVIAVTGSGGVGVSTLTAALARRAAACGALAVVLDLDPDAVSLRTRLAAGSSSAADLSEIFSALAPSDAGDAVDDDSVPRPVSAHALEPLLVSTHSPELSYVGYQPSPRPCDAVAPSALEAFLCALANRAEFVFVAGLSDPSLRALALGLADVRVVVYEPTLASVSVVVHSLSVLGPEATSVVLVSNSPRSRRSLLLPSHVRYALGDRDTDVTFPFDAALPDLRPGVAPSAGSSAFAGALRALYVCVAGVALP